MSVSRRLLAKIFIDQLEQTDSKAKLTRSLAAYILERKQYKQTDMIINDIVAELARRGHVLARAMTAKPLSSEQRSTITATVAKATGARAVELIEEVEPAIIGGVRLTLPGRELDASIRRQLQQLQAEEK